MVEHPWLLLALVIPLTMDTFVLSSALGLAGLPRHRHLRTSVILALFEAVMPVVGVIIGRGLGHIIGQFAGYTAAVIIGLAGLILLWPTDKRTKNQRKKKLLARTRGLAIIDLGLSISIDELAIGISLGLLGIPVWLAAAVIGLQAFVASQAGLRVGAHISTKLEARAERLTGAILIVVAIAMVVLKLTSDSF